MNKYSVVFTALVNYQPMNAAAGNLAASFVRFHVEVRACNLEEAIQNGKAVANTLIATGTQVTLALESAGLR